MYDILIENGKLIDGTGAPWFYSDIGVKDNRIAKIGRNIKGRAKRIIDANGNVVCPGFIDIHTHSDIPLLVNPKAEGKVYQGVTLDVGGNCGISPAPVYGKARMDLSKQLLDDYDIKMNWETYGEYLNFMGQEGISINYASFVGHGSIREVVMGYKREKPTFEELKMMKKVLELALEQGAFGISTGLVYPPGSYADTEEIISIAKTAAKNDGIYVTHIRDEADAIVEAVNEALLVGQEADIPVHISHHKAIGKGNWGKVQDTLGLMEDARKLGLDTTCDIYPYTATSTNLSSIIPDKFMTGDITDLIVALKNPNTRAEIMTETDKLRNKHGDWSDVYISFVSEEKNKIFEGKNLQEIGKMVSRHPCDVAINLIIEEGDKADKVSFGMCEDDIKFVMKHRLSMIGSDGSARSIYSVMGKGKPHPRSYGTFPRVLGKYVRDEGLFPLEEAIKKMTGFPAWRLRLHDRGILREGNWADIVVFDENNIIDVADYNEPHRYGVGILYVMVNGTIVLDDGEHTGLFPGKLLRKGE